MISSSFIVMLSFSYTAFYYALNVNSDPQIRWFTLWWRVSCKLWHNDQKKGSGMKIGAAVTIMKLKGARAAIIKAVNF